MSVPDLGQREEVVEQEEREEEQQEERVSPRSCPSSPRKQSVGLPHQDTVSLNPALHSPIR